jgi:Ni/Fe-hydrogenase subunit HybB-like protein
MRPQQEIKIWTPTTAVLLLIMFLGFFVAIYRLINGLGASTNLNDIWPWGLWIGVDVLGGVAMAAGGFIIAGAVYIFNWKKYKPIVRPAILTAFFGYLLAIVALFFDIGRPFRLWHPSVMWQVNSIMFIVAIHVILYTLTLATEFSPMMFEKLKLEKPLGFVKKIMVPVVLFGVLLSVLHQSSLGALYLIVPSKLSPLWYNSQIPFLFLVSAVILGLSMVSFETILSIKSFGHKVNMGILSGLSRGSIIAIIIYLILKLWFLAKGPGIGAAFDGSMEANMYLLEMVIGIVIPLVLFSMQKIRNRLNVILAANILVIAGVIINRLNISIFGLVRYSSETGASYFPSWMEFAITLALISLAVFGFKVAAKYLQLFPEAEGGH